MLRPDAVHVQDFGQFVEAPVQVVAELHEVLDVVHRGEVDLRLSQRRASASSFATRAPLHT